MTDSDPIPQPPPRPRADLLYEAVDATLAWWRRRDAAVALCAYDDDEAAAVLGRMLVKADDTAITDATARGLLTRDDEYGLTLVLAGMAVADPNHRDYLIYPLDAAGQSGASDIDGLLAAIDTGGNRWARAGATQFRAWRDSNGRVSPEPAVGTRQWAIQTWELHGLERKLATIPLLGTDDEGAAALGRLLLDPNQKVSEAAASAVAARNEPSELTVLLAAFALATPAGGTVIRRQVTSARQDGNLDFDRMLPGILAGPDPWARQGARKLIDWLSPSPS